jgi:hypothetical protein
VTVYSWSDTSLYIQTISYHDGWRAVITAIPVCHELGSTHFNSLYSVKKKGKAVPLQAWSGPEGSRKLRVPDYTTAEQDGGKVVSLTHRPPLPLLLVLTSVGV